MRQGNRLRLPNSWAQKVTLFGLTVVLSCGPSAQKLESVNDQVVASAAPTGDPLKGSSDASQAVKDTIVTVAGGNSNATGQDVGGGALAPGGGILQVEKTTVSGSTLQTYEGSVSDSLVAIQVKSLDLLQASIEGCFGTLSSTKLRTEMFILNDFLTPVDERDFAAEGQRQFLNEFSYLDSIEITERRNVDSTKIGVADEVKIEFVGGKAPDVLELEAENLNDTSNSVRMGVSVDTLSDRYLRSLETVAQVVAHNCNLKSGGACDCTTPELAAAMITRCLPTVMMSDDELNSAAKAMATQCAVSKFEQRRAIASLISSYAFASRR